VCEKQRQKRENQQEAKGMRHVKKRDVLSLRGMEGWMVTEKCGQRFCISLLSTLSCSFLPSSSPLSHFQTLCSWGWEVVFRLSHTLTETLVSTCTSAQCGSQCARTPVTSCQGALRRGAVLCPSYLLSHCPEPLENSL